MGRLAGWVGVVAGLVAWRRAETWRRRAYLMWGELERVRQAEVARAAAEFDLAEHAAVVWAGDAGYLVGCKCGWRGDVWVAEELAEQEGVEHIREAYA